MININKAKTAGIFTEIIAEIQDGELYLQLGDIDNCKLIHKHLIVDGMETQEKLYKKNKKIKNHGDYKVGKDMISALQVDFFIEHDKITDYEIEVVK